MRATAQLESFTTQQLDRDALLLDLRIAELSSQKSRSRRRRESRRTGGRLRRLLEWLIFRDYERRD